MNNGYVTIGIDGKTIGLKFGMPSLQMLLKKSLQFPEIWDEQTTFSAAGLAYLLLFGYRNNCMIKETVPKYGFEFFLDYVESVAHDVELAKPLSAVVSCWAESREVKRLTEKPINTVEDDESVKKNNGSLTKSNPIATGALV